MGNMYDDMNVLKSPGTGNLDGTLSTATLSLTLTAGGWAIWADQSYQLEIATASGTQGAKPHRWPANYVFYYTVPHGETEYALFERISTSGTAYANAISGPV